MNAIALQEPVSKLKGSFTDCALPGKPFIWLPFAGGISAFAVILPKPGLRLRRFGLKRSVSRKIAFIGVWTFCREPQLRGP